MIKTLNTKDSDLAQIWFKALTANEYYSFVGKELAKTGEWIIRYELPVAGSIKQAVAMIQDSISKGFSLTVEVPEGELQGITWKQDRANFGQRKAERLSFYLNGKRIAKTKLI